MALAGVRDMSVIHTPPEARLPVKTFVSEDSAEPVREAILRELERDGQVFFLHNRVRTIHNIADELGKLVPEARILVGHGQMPEAELEDVMVAFANREADVLVCTTIIESGLDMPNVNTIIIDRADRFGLAQLYQLRGRVGRGDHRAYAYLLLPDNQEITEAASKRIHAILEANELGAGFRIAMRDLEIRGAGNLLGADQSGQIHAVGLNLYSELLNQAVQDLSKDGSGAVVTDTMPPPRIDMQVSASIPSDYIAHLPARLAFYQRLSNVADRTQISAVRSDMQDRFGPLPDEVENLLTITDLRCLGATAGVESIAGGSDGIITVVFRHPVGDARQALQNKMGPGIKVGRRDLEVRTAGDTDHGVARLARALRRVGTFVDEMREAMEAAQEAAGSEPAVQVEGTGRIRRRRRPTKQPVAVD
jgi:transcription-repair coupling factor (superfamily II helicase)